MKLALGLLSCVIAGAVGAYYARPYAGNNADIVLIVITVFSVFAGFLIAIITIIGDPIMIREGSWRAAEMRRDLTHARLIFHIALFVCYLLTIVLLFVGAILEKALPKDTCGVVKETVEWLYLFFGI